MKKLFLCLLIFILFFCNLGCSCNKEKTISNEEATSLLKQANKYDNVKVATSTETNVNNVKSTSTQIDIVYENKYYHFSENNNITTKTWYGYIDNVLYAFYYTKNSNNQESKFSSKIDTNQLVSAQLYPSSIINDLFDNSGALLENHTINGTKKNKTYTLEIRNNSLSNNSFYTVIIRNGRINKIVKTSSFENNTIKVTYDYSYDIGEITLPTLNEYPLAVNN